VNHPIPLRATGFCGPPAESLDARLKEVWPRNTRFAKRAFARLQRAYVEARYSPEYEITDEELAWLVERVSSLKDHVETICAEKIGLPN
jgi:uncharacterized protein